MAIFVLGIFCTMAAFATGGGAEEAIEHLPGVSKKLIHTHEEAADTFGIFSYVLGGLSLIGLWLNWKQKNLSIIVTYIILVFSIITIFFASRAGSTGGNIRHPEIRIDTIKTN
jgi:uncharacterized membrane protein